MNRFIRIIFFVVLIIAVFAVNIYASAEYTDTLRVGIYYDSTTVANLELNSSDGFAVGLFEDRQFNNIIHISDKTVCVGLDKIENNQAYYVDYSAYNTIEELNSALVELREQGIKAFVGYINSEYHIIGGPYKNNNDALWAAENLQVKGKVIQTSGKSIKLENIIGETVFVVDDVNLGLTVYSNEYENTDALLTISGSAKGTYRGGFEFRTLDANKMTVVNTIPVEAYLYSVVCREMSPSWEVEALKAQAVCARNFALGRINYHKKYGFDVCRTVCCQAYATTADNSESVHKAVNETKGKLLFYEDKLVQAVYSSSMGRRTESVENVWGTPFPYLVSVENPYEDTQNIYNGKWTKTLSKNRATEIMNSRGYNIGEVTDIVVLERTPADSVLKLQVQGTKGNKIFERESCRGIFSEVTYSQRYTVSRGGQATYPTVYTTDGRQNVCVNTNKLTVLSGNNSKTTIDGDCFVFDGETKKEYNAISNGGDENTFVFDGEGWGHGVGMSQYGAKGMAQAGFTYDEILTHYYTDTYIKKAY